MNVNIKKYIYLLITFILFSQVYNASISYAKVIVSDDNIEYYNNNVTLSDENYTLNYLKNTISSDDYQVLIELMRKYLRGEDSARNDITILLSKYNIFAASYIVNYLLDHPTIKHVALYYHNGDELTFTEVPYLCDTVESESAKNVINIVWPLIKETMPSDVVSEIKNIILEENRDEDDRLTITSSDPRNASFDMHVDMDLVYNIGILQNELAAATIMMYVLDESEVDFSLTKGNNYKFNNLYYKDDSFINTFYEKFWRGRKIENADDQYGKYDKDFLSKKAGKNVYSDMAVSFLTYMREGVNNKSNAMRNMKQNFFDDYVEFQYLAMIFRKKLNLNSYIQ